MRDTSHLSHNEHKQDFEPLIKGHPEANTVFDGTCGWDKTAPKEFLNLNGPLDNLARLTLSDQGAQLNFLAEELWARCLGPYSLLIPKAKLIEMGAKDLWGNSSK